MNSSAPNSNITPDAARSFEDRMQAIRRLVREQGYQSIESLAERFAVTTQTIRRDVNALCERGLCRRKHGGVDLMPGIENLAYATRQTLNLEAKQRIARSVAAHIPSGASLFFGIGTTPEQCAIALGRHEALRVMTNNLNVAFALRHNPGCEVTVAGGRMRNTDGDVVAGEAHGFFSRYSVDIGIYGAGGVSDDGALLDFSHDETRMRAELVAHCRQRVLVLDHSKFGRGATVREGHITEASLVFTDQPVPEQIAAMLQHAGIALIVARPSPTAPSLQGI